MAVNEERYDIILIYKANKTIPFTFVRFWNENTKLKNTTSNIYLKLYGGYKYAMPCMINRILGLKQQ